MIISLISGAIAVLNAAGFLLMAAGPALLEFIVISSIFSVTTWMYSWILPAAVGYRDDRLPQLRLTQAVAVATGSAVILVTHPGTMAVLFVAMMVADCWIFPQHMLLFRSDTALYLRMELVRGLANSVALLAAIFLFDGDPLHYVQFLLINVAVAGACLAATGVHRPPPVAMAHPGDALAMIRSMLTSRNMLALLSARGLEIGTMMALSRAGALPAVLSLKIGLAISAALAANARARALPVLWTVHLLVYGAGTGAILLLNQLQIPSIPIPEALALVNARSALLVVPIVLASFSLTVLGLRSATPDRQRYEQRVGDSDPNL